MDSYFFNPHQQHQSFSEATPMTGVESSSSDKDNKKSGKNANLNRACRPVAIKQIKDAAVLGESTYKIDGEEVTDITFVGVVRSITKQDNNTSYMIEDGTAVIDVKHWKMVEDEYGETNQLIAPDMYVRVTGRLHQFNSHINNVAAHFISIIQDFNELTYHFLETIYTHLTIGKLDIIVSMNNFNLNISTPGNYTMIEKEMIVKRVIQENYNMDGSGAYIPQVKNCLKDTFTGQEIDSILEDLLTNQGQAYQTIDDAHIKLVEDN